MKKRTRESERDFSFKSMTERLCQITTSGLFSSMKTLVYHDNLYKMILHMIRPLMREFVLIKLDMLIFPCYTVIWIQDYN